MCAAVTVTKGLLSIGIAVDNAAMAVALGATGNPIGGVLAAYGLIGSTGQGSSGVIQVIGGLSGNAMRANSAAALLTTATTLLGGAALIVTKGDLGVARKWATLESLGMTGLNGGMSGNIMESGRKWLQKVLSGADLMQSTADILDIPTDGGCL